MPNIAVPALVAFAQQSPRSQRFWSATPASLPSDTGAVTDRNVLGGELEPCGTDPITGFFRDGCCRTGPEDRGSHTICAVVTSEFLEHQRRIGNDLITPMPHVPTSLGSRPGTAGA